MRTKNLNQIHSASEYISEPRAKHLDGARFTGKNTGRIKTDHLMVLLQSAEELCKKMDPMHTYRRLLERERERESERERERERERVRERPDWRQWREPSRPSQRRSE